MALTRAVVLGWGWVGVGWDANASLDLDRMVDATQLMGWDANASLDLDRIQCIAFFLDPKSIDNTDFHSMFLSSASIM